MITSQKLQAVIDKIQREFLKRLQCYRQQCAQLDAKQTELPFPTASHHYRNFSVGTFAHQFTVGLAVSQFSIGVVVNV